jgi:hypothetical protein
LDEELLDAMNYAEEAAQQSFPVAVIADLRRLCERIRAIYHAAGTSGEPAGNRKGKDRVEWVIN